MLSGAAFRARVLAVTSSLHRRAFQTAGNSGGEQDHDELWKHVYRDFILKVHPDFFQDFPKERAVNEKSLKAFSQHLERLEAGGGTSKRSGSAPLVFFVKATAGGGGSAVEGDAVGHKASQDGGVEANSASPRKFLLPLEAHHQLHTHLQQNGITTVTPPPPPSSPHQRPADHASVRYRNDSAGPHPAEEMQGDNPGWHVWGDHLFGETAANRAWQEAAGGGGGRRTGYGRSAFSGQQDSTREGRQRTTEWGAAFEGARGGGGDASEVLGRVLATDAGRALVRERRASSKNVRRLVDELRREYDFGKITFRCGWSRSNLSVALGSLLETCRAHRETLNVSGFGGLEVVFRNDPSVLHKGEIRLCPADVPNQWLSVLQRVTPAVVSRAHESSREMASLQERASSVLRGARLSRGLSCSERRYREFLGRVCATEEEVEAGDESGTEVSLGDWSALRCRVEEGFSRVSKVLEDGTIQVGSEMAIGTLRRCLERDFASSAAAAAESAALAAAAERTADRCRRSLGLEGVGRAPRAVSLSQMLAACEALAEFGERADGGDLGAEAVAARRRLRGHCVMVVGERVGVCDGLTEDGEIVIPWNWNSAAEDENKGGSWGGERQSPAPFY